MGPVSGQPHVPVRSQSQAVPDIILPYLLISGFTAPEDQGCSPMGLPPTPQAIAAGASAQEVVHAGQFMVGGSWMGASGTA